MGVHSFCVLYFCCIFIGKVFFFHRGSFFPITPVACNHASKHVYSKTAGLSCNDIVKLGFFYLLTSTNCNYLSLLEKICLSVNRRSSLASTSVRSLPRFSTVTSCTSFTETWSLKTSSSSRSWAWSSSRTSDSQTNLVRGNGCKRAAEVWRIRRRKFCSEMRTTHPQLVRIQPLVCLTAIRTLKFDSLELEP